MRQTHVGERQGATDGCPHSTQSGPSSVSDGCARMSMVSWGSSRAPVFMLWSPRRVFNRTVVSAGDHENAGSTLNRDRADDSFQEKVMGCRRRSADESAIRTVNVNWGKAYNGGDAKAVTALYADDAVLLPPGAPSARGKVAILDFYTKDIADTKAQGAELVLACEPGDRSPAPCKSQTELAVSGNMGWEVGYLKVIVKGAVVNTGKWLSVIRKKDGKWQLFRDTWNMDTPPAPLEAKK
jgi:ketosteroid isomerase-like protein